jgi:hypothetical protein
MPAENACDSALHQCSIALLSCARACIGCSDAAVWAVAEKPAAQAVHACSECAGACLSLHRLLNSPGGADVGLIEMCGEACRCCERICHIYTASHVACARAAMACGRAADACRELSAVMRARAGEHAAQTVAAPAAEEA